MNEKSPRVRRNSSVRLSPGASVTFWNRFKRFTAGVTLATRSATKSCTTSVPARPPVFFTVTDTPTGWPNCGDGGVTSRPEYAKVV